MFDKDIIRLLIQYSQKTASLYRADRIALVLGVCMILSSTVFQKLALPGSGGNLPISVLLVPLIILVGLATSVLQISRETYIPFALLLVIGLCNFAASKGPFISLPSLALFATVQGTLIFRFSSAVSVALPLHHFFRNTILVLAVLGVIQFGLQFIAGPSVAFFLDFHLPVGVIARNYNVLNPLYWNSPIFKSNGFFLLEPSFFSQLVAIGIALEIVIWRDPRRLLVLTLATLLSFSGTGLTMLALFLPLYAISKRQYGILLVACALAAIVFLAAEPLGLTALTSRVSEFGSQSSSGWARFVSPLVYLQDVAFQGPWAFLLGEGPGSIEGIKSLPYFSADPTWAKLIYEYGFVGLMVYGSLFYSAFVRSRMPLRFPLGYTYVMLGGYLLNPSIVAQLAILVVWTERDQISGLANGIRGPALPLPAMETVRRHPLPD